jgi:hypothetical protein
MRYSSTVRARPSTELAKFSVFAPFIMSTARICRWSCRLSPPPAGPAAPQSRGAVTAAPGQCSTAAGSAASRWLLLREPLRRAAFGRRVTPHCCTSPPPTPCSAMRTPHHAPTTAPRHDFQSSSPGCDGDGWGAKRPGCVPAPARPLVDVEIADAFFAAGVEVVARRYAIFAGHSGKCLPNIPFQALIFELSCAAMPVQRGKIRILRRAGIKATVILMRVESRQAVLPMPRRIPGQRRPAIIVARLSAHVDHPIDRRAAAERFAARIAHATAVQPRRGLGFKQPVGAQITDAIKIADGHMDPRRAVLLPSLDHQ